MIKKIKRKYLEKILKMKNVNHNRNILTLKTLKRAHIYCKINKLSGQISGPLIEYYIINKNNLIKNKSSDCIGDCSKIYYNNLDSEMKEKTIKNFEIKASLGGIQHNKFNYVQLRMNHNIDFYILTAYYLSKENIKNKGELFVFMISKIDLKNIIFKYGNYAHGTLNKNGKRTFDVMNETDKNEYAIRPKYGDNCWKELLNFKVDDKNIFLNLDLLLNDDNVIKNENIMNLSKRSIDKELFSGEQSSKENTIP